MFKSQELSLLSRGQKGQSSLRDILQPLVKEILDDKSLSIHTSPVDVYKQWINQTETETGKPSELPYDVDNETAMKHPEVVAKVEASIKCLQVAADKFLNSIIKSTDLIPYGMKYVAMTLREALSEKFPQAGEDDILKVRAKAISKPNQINFENSRERGRIRHCRDFFSLNS